jgi:3-deoxy-D-manno-octulosonic-acid transferase
LLNLLYIAFLSVLSPWLVYKSLTTGKYRRGLLRKLTGRGFRRESDSSCAWFHGVSVGEIHLLRQVVTRFRHRHPDWDCVISTTTDTAFDEACKCFHDLPVFYWPLDFTWAVRRALRMVKPSLVILAEGELWPNFVHAAKARGIPIALINGRMSPRSFQRYFLLPALVRHLFAQVDLFVAQTQEYAERYLALGAPTERVRVAGSVKYDGVAADRQNARTQQLGRLLNVAEGDLIWVAGSTQAPEEEIVIEIYRRARADHPHLRLLLVPRQKERFSEVASLLERTGEKFLRRSGLAQPISDRNAIILVDTIGELGALWGLADVAFVGGSLDGRRGGQNMIEPAAYGAAVVFGPHVWNFRDTAERLVATGASIQVADAKSLEDAIHRLLKDSHERHRLGTAAQQFVLSQQGATERTMDHIDRLLAHGGWSNQAA